MVPSMAHRWAIDGPWQKGRRTIDGPSMGMRWSIDGPWMGCPGIPTRVMFPAIPSKDNPAKSISTPLTL